MFLKASKISKLLVNLNQKFITFKKINNQISNKTYSVPMEAHIDPNLNVEDKSKKKKAFDKKTKQKQKDKEKKTPDQYVNYVKELKSEKFEFYYKNQFIPSLIKNEEEFNVFLDKLKEKLPCAFRINVSNLFWKAFQEKLINSEFQKKYFKNEEIPFKIAIKNLVNLPEFQNLVFNMDISRQDLKKKENYMKFHKFIQSSVDSGIISRQEAVSMIPPMLMNVKAGSTIFDMCAAPGSKTAQFLEIFYKNYDFFDLNSIKNDTGFVLANDNNVDRAFLMTHQLKRLNTAGMIVVSHDAQGYPTIYDEKENKIFYDSILCDVPCSSDAVMRKLPHKWKIWSPKDSFGLHRLQLLILRRAVSLAKEGGTIIYSTCSLNPIENEAVVSEVMRNFSDCLEIVDVHHLFLNSHAKSRKGLTSWKVFTESKEDNNKLIEIESKNCELYGEYKSVIDSSCFPDEEKKMLEVYKTQNCVRIFPHDSDTSGFFITVLRKKATLNNEKTKTYNLEKPKAKEDKGIKYISENSEIVEWIKDYYGITEKFPFSQIVTQSIKNKKLHFISKGVKKYLDQDKRNHINLISCGVKIFSFNKLKNLKNEDFHCRYRVCQDAVMYLIPYMKKRVLFCLQRELIQILKKKDVLHKDLLDERLKEQLSNTKSGCVVLICVKEIPLDTSLINKDEEYLEFLKNNFIDVVCCYNSAVRIESMVNEEHQHIFNLKFDI